MRKQEHNELEEALEDERMRLAACSTAALQNTKKTVKDRISRDNKYWSVAYGDICDAVDREMQLRYERDLYLESLSDIALTSSIMPEYDWETCARNALEIGCMIREGEK